MWQKLKNYYHLLQAVLANIYYGFPARKLTVIGVTGTDGKTTTATLIYHIFKSSGKNAALISTIGAYIGDKTYDIGFHVTTPSPFGLQKYIKQAVDNGVDSLVLETTSHALDQYRVWGIPYKIGVLTNITHEHLDYHRTYEKYAEAKFKLILNSETGIMNYDDESYTLLISNNKIVTYSLHDKQADYTLEKFPFKTNLIGEFNQYNCLAAIAAVKQIGLNDTDIKKAILTFIAPTGRQEVVYDKDFKVIIDFAHTPNGFAQLLPEVKKLTRNKLIHVFGSAGLRDKTKRPEMGREAAKYDDIIVLTGEDPRSEQVEEINRQIRKGIDKNFKYQISNIKPKEESSKSKLENYSKYLFEISDRKEAIGFAIKIARKGDTVLLTGKAHEKSMNYGHNEEPWDEFKTVRDNINNLPHLND
jgi:UDP-N-acetylmuramoyl-L-alanyl-D-glutamate--2,6-diaminopimelate ligase